jgi:hypothetical protein
MEQIMSTTSSASAAAEAAPMGAAGGSWRWRRLRWIVLVGVVVPAVAVAAVAVVDPFAKSVPVRGVVDNGDSTSTLAVTRQDLSSQTQVSATLGYAGSYSVVNQVQGTVTSLPSVGRLVSQGQVLYGVSGAPVVLLYGMTPAYRTLSEGLTGADVEELNADLGALGYVTSAELSPTSDEFTWWTEVGVEKLQAELGVTDNGTLSQGQAVFLPTAARITSVLATLGAPAQPGQSVLSATSTTRQVSVALGADQQSEAAVGDQVTIALPNNKTTPGVVLSVGTVATSSSSGSSGSGSSSPTITVLVDPTEPAATGDWDQAPVDVTIVTGSVTNALVVPVDALLAQSGGGYAVEVVDSDGIHRLEDVSLGLFDDVDGLVQVTGSGLVAGQRIVVPAL